MTKVYLLPLVFFKAHFIWAFVNAYDVPIDHNNIFTVAADETRKALSSYQNSAQSLKHILDTIDSCCMSSEDNEDCSMKESTAISQLENSLDSCNCPYGEILNVAFKIDFLIKEKIPILLDFSHLTQEHLVQAIDSYLNLTPSHEECYDIRDDLELVNSYYEQALTLKLALGYHWARMMNHDTVHGGVTLNLNRAVATFLIQLEEANQRLLDAYNLYKKGIDLYKRDYEEQLVAKQNWRYNAILTAGFVTAAALPFFAYWVYKYGYKVAFAAFAQRFSKEVIDSSSKRIQAMSTASVAKHLNFNNELTLDGFSNPVGHFSSHF